MLVHLVRCRGQNHIGGERAAVRALAAGEAAAACMLESNHKLFVNEGILEAGTSRVLAATPHCDHCNFTVRDDLPEDRTRRFLEVLLAMSFQDPEVRPLIELEGLKQWLPGRVSGYALVLSKILFNRAAACRNAAIILLRA